jgi:hypothetical protein
MKKISLFLGMIAFIAFTTSCETDTVEQDSQELISKSGGFEAESAYFNILANTESGMDQFDALTNSQKQAVWLFKYTRFKNDNTLTGLQEEAVDELMSYINEADFSEFNLAEVTLLEDSINENFDLETSGFLLATLENNEEDVSNQVNGKRFWGSEYSWGSCGPNSNGDGGCSEGQYRTYRVFWFAISRDKPVRGEDGLQVTRPCDC